MRTLNTHIFWMAIYLETRNIIHANLWLGLTFEVCPLQVSVASSQRQKQPQNAMWGSNRVLGWSEETWALIP